VRRVFPDHSYVSLDLPAAAEQAENSPRSFLGDYSEPLIIDEVQYAPALFRHLKVKIDEDKRPGRYVLTGSQNFPLVQGISETLAGRGGRFTAIEAKFTERPERSDLKGLEALETFYGPNSLVNGIIACRAARTYKMTARVSAVPVKKIDQHLG
jgi:predicted AAA+ superfamily ATPase